MNIDKIIHEASQTFTCAYCNEAMSSFEMSLRNEESCMNCEDHLQTCDCGKIFHIDGDETVTSDTGDAYCGQDCLDNARIDAEEKHQHEKAESASWRFR